MRRKILQGYANNLCAMLIGWRMGEDLEVMANLPDGVILVNVLNGVATHSLVGVIELSVTKELQVWFLDRLKESNISSEDIKLATVKAGIKTDRIATNRKKIVSFDFTLQSEIKTDERSYVGKLNEVHRWHQRRPLINHSGRAPNGAP